jgi:hypothetical protein
MEGCDECWDASTCSVCSIGWEFNDANGTCGEIDSTCYGDSHWIAAKYECMCNNPHTDYDSTPNY